MLKVNEIFGPTIQGEGPAAGRHCMFVRLANCNLECTWCDTPYTWAFSESKKAKLEKPYEGHKSDEIHNMSEDLVFEQLCRLWPMRSHPTIVVISGGEPLMQAEMLEPLVGMLRSLNHRVHIETAGTLFPTALLSTVVDTYVVSPKLAHSGNILSKRWKPEVLSYFGALGKAWFKFVVRNVSDIEECDELVLESGITPSRVMLMPEGTTAEALLNTERNEVLVEEAVKRGWGFSFRSHILLWGDKRGV
jgi:7-carboxy-7-deazaguanine synthase